MKHHETPCKWMAVAESCDIAEQLPMLSASALEPGGIRCSQQQKNLQQEGTCAIFKSATIEQL